MSKSIEITLVAAMREQTSNRVSSMKYISISQPLAKDIMKLQEALSQSVHQQPEPEVTEFSTGLCDCFSDVPLCCLTFWCPCITFGRIAEIVDRGSPSCGGSGAMYTLVLGLTGCQWVYSTIYRSRLKAQFGIRASRWKDCCAHFWCECCALCQEYRELRHRGFDVEIGWQGDMEKQNLGMTGPSIPSGMNR